MEVLVKAGAGHIRLKRGSSNLSAQYRNRGSSTLVFTTAVKAHLFGHSDVFKGIIVGAVNNPSATP